jgi:hypothetical protein
MHTRFWLQNLKQRDHSVNKEDNIRMDVKKIGWEGVDWVHLTQDMDL